MDKIAPTPMEAKLVEALPEGEGWQFEPKWDGFRAIATREGADIAIWSKSGKRLDRYFPELASMLASLKAKRFVVDGEIILPVGDILSFDALQARLHPAASRIAKLSKETPAQLMLFDILALDGAALGDRPLSQRRTALERLHRANRQPSLLLSPKSMDVADAKAWLATSGGALDGVVAKRLDEPYRHGERAMLKVKQLRTADCVVGGFRRAAQGAGIASLLLGLYDQEGKLNHVGFTSAIAADERVALAARLAPLIAPPGFTGKAPGGPSRWNAGKESPWEPLRPELVIEVIYDQVTGERFRHGTRLLRWRPDKAPGQCTMDQLQYELRPGELSTVV
ncbi:ATP-dependent DNA ligase [Sphingomonas sp. 3P27F8]|uniref:ATP-dependent DNA ligase n=1 Tax=Sphingomonas sp. 3P27F8 TaxID=2502213 RepID=UPI001BB26566|nr:ATP-dependent DNA ligase [Sphingomonas sp. 3P27F8]